MNNAKLVALFGTIGKALAFISVRAFLAFRITDAMIWSFEKYVGMHPGGGGFATASGVVVYMQAMAAGWVYFLIGSVCQIFIRKKTLKFQILFDIGFTVLFAITVVLLGATVKH